MTTSAAGLEAICASFTAVMLIFYTMMEEVIHFHGVAVLKTA